MVDNIYVINLDRRTDRWAYMQREMRKFNLKVQRISAVDGNKLDDPK